MSFISDMHVFVLTSALDSTLHVWCIQPPFAMIVSVMTNLFQSHVAADNLVHLILWIHINWLRQLVTADLNTRDVT